MRRQSFMAIGFAFLLPLAVSATTVAQQPKAKPVTAAAPAKDAGAAPVAAATSAGDGGASTLAAGASAPPVSTAVAAGQMDGATYAVRLRDLEARVDELKDQIRRSHTRLALLSDTILSGGAGGSRSEITFHNEMSSAFKLTKALIVLDGAVQYNRNDDTGALADQKEIPVFSGSVPPGDHNISVLLDFQGNGYGVFTYLRGYKFEVKSAHSFTAVEGKTMSITVKAYEAGGVTTPLEQRPKIGWDEKVQALGAPPAAAAVAPGAAPAAGASGGAAVGNDGAKGGFSVGGGTK
ncbi:MAG: hypothetical protein ABIP39_08315 [Polyangiaceae bacterium]